MTWLSDVHDWLKAAHIISMVAWMAGLFYLPRLYVYHAERAEVGSELSETFKVMELKLLKVIMNPAMIATWIFGVLLLLSLGLDAVLSSGWLLVKLVLVIGLTWFHMVLGRWRRAFEADANTRSGKYYRGMNEVPTLVLFVVVILAVVKPF